MTLIQLASLGAGIAQWDNGTVAPGRAGTIYLHDTLTPVTIYTDETGGTVQSVGTFTTDHAGRVPGWVALGLYVDITIPPASLVACIIGGPQGVPGNWRGSYNAGTTYALGDGVTGSNGHNYISVSAGNIGHDPTTDGGVHWSDLLPASVAVLGAAAPSPGVAGQMLIVRSDGTLRYVTPQVIPVDAWGAVGDGVTDDSTAIQNTINSLPVTGNGFTSGGRVGFTSGKRYAIAGQLVVDSLNNITFTSAGARTGGAQIMATGSLASGSASVISARSSKGFTIDPSVALLNANTSFSGRMVDLRTLTAQININNTDRASIKGTITMAQSAGITAIGVDLQNAQASEVDAWITGGAYAVQGMATNADFANSIKVRGYFQGQDLGAVHNLGFASEVSGIFEPLRSGAAGAYLQDSGVPATGLSFPCVSCQDVQAASGGNWFTINGKGISFGGGGIVTSGSTTAKGIVTNGNTDGLSAHGIQFSNLAFAFDPTTGTHGRFDIGGNSYTSAPIMNGNNFGAGSRVEGVAVPKIALAISASGWANQGAPFAPLSYWLDAEGFVHLEGYVAPQAAYTTNTTMATLPAGFRPGYQLRMNAYGNLGGSPALCGITITAAGAILVVTTGMGDIDFASITFAQVN